MTLILYVRTWVWSFRGLPRWLSGKESACQAGDLGSIPGLERSPGEGTGNPLPYSSLKDSMDCMGRKELDTTERLWLQFTYSHVPSAVVGSRLMFVKLNNVMLWFTDFILSYCFFPSWSHTIFFIFKRVYSNFKGGILQNNFFFIFFILILFFTRLPLFLFLYFLREEHALL